MTSIADGSVIIQTSSDSVPSPPACFGEVVLLVSSLRKQGALTRISERVRFARRRFGRYEVIDFLAVLFGYAISEERTLEAFYERLQPFAVPFMALFDRDQLPARSTLSRFVAALTEAPVEALRTLFLEDLVGRPLTHDKQTGNLVDRTSTAWVVFDIDGTREAARQRALPQTEDLPPAFRRLDEVCAPGYTGRKRGQVVRTRTVISQAHSFQWLGSFGNRGNGRYRTELRQGLAAINRYLTAHQLLQEHTLLRLDGHSGTGAVLTDLAGFAFVTRGKEYSALDHPLVQPLRLGQECWQIISQWIWNLRLELGHQLEPAPVRTTEFAPAPAPASPHTAPPAGYAPPQVGVLWKAGRFAGQDFVLQPDGTLRCPSDQKLVPHEQRREADGSLRVVYGASIRSCRPCPLREQGQWNGNATAKPRQVSVLLHPLPVGSAPLLWRDWSRRVHRRACQQLVRHQRLEMSLSPPAVASSPIADVILSRAQRARYRLSWQERLARNARRSTAGPVTMKVFGVPTAFAASLGLATA